MLDIILFKLVENIETAKRNTRRKIMLENPINYLSFGTYGFPPPIKEKFT
tara:strand:+ start:466 stop:615 length:150 start_codon:yes stop_codon:yes gene_type:complete